MTHAYDNPDLGSMDFLLCIMHDPAVPLHLRMDAAAKLLPIYQEIKTIYIKIVGGLIPAQSAAIETKARDTLEWDASNRSILVH